MDSSEQIISAEILEKCISKCRTFEQEIFSHAEPASRLVQKFSAEIRSNSDTKVDAWGDGKMVQPPAWIFSTLLKNLDEKMRNVVDILDWLLKGMEWHLKQWKTQQLHKTVGRRCQAGPQDTTYVEKMCEEICSCVNNMIRFAVGPDLQRVNSMRRQMTDQQVCPDPMPLIDRLEAVLRQITTDFFVFHEQPELTIIKAQKEEEESNKSKKFKMVVGLLGGAGFGNNLTITDGVIYLAFNGDLAQAHGRKPQRSFRLDCEEDNSPSVTFKKAFEYSGVEKFSRHGINLPVYKQLYHVVFDANLHAGHLMKDFKCQAVSLPVMVRTASNQASEQVGALLWHSFSARNVYDFHCSVAETMQVDDVVTMIKERISLPGRELRQDELTFLRERITMAATGKSKKRPRQPCNQITLYKFIKENVSLPSPVASSVQNGMQFSLWRWLHSIINLVQDTIKGPWKDGIVAGFVSREWCIRALENRSISDGTFLLRFSESQVKGNYINCKGALAVVVKFKGRAAFASPMTAEVIEESGLGNQIETTGRNVCKFLMGTNWTVRDVKEQYPPKKEDPRYLDFENNRRNAQSEQKQQQQQQAGDQELQLEGQNAGSPFNIPRTVLAELALRNNGQKTGGQMDSRQFLGLEGCQGETMDMDIDQDSSVTQQVAPTYQIGSMDQSMETEPSVLHGQSLQLSLAAASGSSHCPVTPAFSPSVVTSEILPSMVTAAVVPNTVASAQQLGTATSPAVVMPLSSQVSVNTGPVNGMGGPGTSTGVLSAVEPPASGTCPVPASPGQRQQASSSDSSQMLFSMHAAPSSLPDHSQASLSNMSVSNLLVGQGDPIMSAACDPQAPASDASIEDFHLWDDHDLDELLKICGDVL